MVRESVEKERSTQLQLDKIRRLMDFTGVGSSKVYFTEANNTIANRDYLNDSCFRAAFFANETMQIHDQADLLCVMTGTDWVSSYLDSGAVVHGGIGLLTKDTIRKPAYFASGQSGNCFRGRLYPDTIGERELLSALQPFCAV